MISQSGSDLLRHWHIGELTFWRDVHPFLLMVWISSKTGEGLTDWMGVHPRITPSCQWIISAQTLDRDSQTGWVIIRSCQRFRSATSKTLDRDSLSRCQSVFTHSDQCFGSAQTLERDSQTEWVFTRSGQWFRSAQTLERDSLPGWVFISSGQWPTSTTQTLERDSLPGCVFTLSCQWFRSDETLDRYSQTGWVFTSPGQWFRSAQTLERDSLPGECSSILVSGSDLLKHQRGTHSLDVCSPILVSGSNLLKNWRGTHSLDVCSVFTHSHQGFRYAQTLENSLPGWVFTHSHQGFRYAQTLERNSQTGWVRVHPFWSVVLICSITGEGLTNWMGIHPFWSVIRICSNNGEGLTPWMVFTHSCQWFRSVQTIEMDSLPGWCSPLLVSGLDLLKHWRGTHSLDGCSPNLLSGSNPLK